MTLDVLQHGEMQALQDRLAQVEKERDLLRAQHKETAQRLQALADGKPVASFWLDIMASNQQRFPSSYSLLLHREPESKEWFLVSQDEINAQLLNSESHIVALPKSLLTFASSPSCPIRSDMNIQSSADWFAWKPFLEKNGFISVVMLNICLKNESDYLMLVFQTQQSALNQDIELMLKDDAHLIKVAAIRESADRQLLEESHYDVKTGLLRRYSFENNFSLVLKDARRHFLRVALISLKVRADASSCDDKSLKAIGEVIKNTVRDNDLVAYYGEGEFVMGVRIRHMQDAEVVANKLLKAIRLPDQNENRLTQEGVAIGVAYYPEHSSLSDLYRAASYASKSVSTEFGFRIEFHGSVYTSSSEFYTF